MKSPKGIPYDSYKPIYLKLRRWLKRKALQPSSEFSVYSNNIAVTILVRT
ncbi:MAG: hypothetical protein ACOYMQ_02280 [Pseudanabaena sp.]